MRRLNVGKGRASGGGNDRYAAERQVQIVELGGLKLLLPLTKSQDIEVQRLAAHALANLSVNSKETRGGHVRQSFA